MSRPQWLNHDHCQTLSVVCDTARDAARVSLQHLISPDSFICLGSSGLALLEGRYDGQRGQAVRSPRFRLVRETHQLSVTPIRADNHLPGLGYWRSQTVGPDIQTSVEPSFYVTSAASLSRLPPANVTDLRSPAPICFRTLFDRPSLPAWSHLPVPASQHRLAILLTM